MNARVRRLLGFRRPQAAEEVAAIDTATEHRVFGEQLDLELERAKRGGRPVSVLIAELPLDFSSNGATGVSPMEALRVTAGVVGEQKRRIDTMACIADNRFGLILPDTSESGALALSQRLRNAIANSCPPEVEPAAVSFGIASFPRHGRTPAALLTAAERALNAVQTLGGNRSLLESAATPSTIVSVGKGDQLADQRLEVVLALAETVDVRDQGSAGHSQTVGRYSELIARELGLSVRQADRVRLAGLLHDVGKVGVPEEVLRKPGPLDDRERALVQKHSEVAAHLLDDPELEDVASWVLAHQERPDGKGYPHGLKGEEVPLEGRILAVADAYEAMTSERTYRETLSHDAAQTELIECAGTQFDKRVVQAFFRALEREGLRLRTPSLLR